MVAKLPHKLSHPVGQFVNSTARHNLLSAGVGAGKSLALIYRAFYLAQKYPKSIGFMCMYTFTALQDVMMPKVWAVLEPLAERVGYKFYHEVKGKHKIVFDNGSEWWFRHVDKEENVRGRDVDYVCIDELTVDIDESVYAQLMARVRNSPHGSLNSVTNPGPKSHWAYNRWIGTPKPNHEVIYLKTTDNKHLPADYIQDLLENNSEWWVKQFVEGQWGVLENAAFYLQPGVHIRDDRPEGVSKYYLAMDWGYNDPFWCILFSVTDRCMHIEREYHGRKMLSQAHLPNVLRMIDDFKRDMNAPDLQITGFTADTADSSLKEKAGTRLIRWWSYRLQLPYYRTVKSRWTGWMALLGACNVRPLHRPRLTFSTQVPATVDSLSVQVWDEEKEDFEDNDNDHGADDVRYAWMAFFNGQPPVRNPIERVDPGDD